MRGAGPRTRSLKILASALLAGCLGSAALCAEAAPIWQPNLAPSADGLPLRAEPAPLRPGAPPLARSSTAHAAQPLPAHRLGLASAADARMIARDEFATYSLSAARPRLHAGFRGEFEADRLAPPRHFPARPLDVSLEPDSESQADPSFATRVRGIGPDLDYRFR